MQRAWEWLAENFRQNTYLGYLAIARMLVGYHFIDVAWPKITQGFYLGQSLPEPLADAVDDPIAWHHDFILNVVLPPQRECLGLRS